MNLISALEQKTFLSIAEALVVKLLRASALNLLKDLIEGLLEIEKLTWGLLYNTVQLNSRFPDPKLEKTAFLLKLPAFD